MKFKKIDKATQEQIRKAVLLMRFRTEQPTKKSLVYCTYKLISNTLNVPYGSV